jgi:hypothetical protein
MFDNDIVELRESKFNHYIHHFSDKQYMNYDFTKTSVTTQETEYLDDEIEIDWEEY